MKQHKNNKKVNSSTKAKQQSNKKNEKATKKAEQQSNKKNEKATKKAEQQSKKMDKKTYMKVKLQSRKMARKSFVRSMVALVILLICLISLLVQIGYWQFVRGIELRNRQYAQSTANSVIAAKRGTIYDSNGKALAISANVDTITVNPEYIGTGKSEAEKVEIKKKLAQKMADIFELEYDKVLEKLNSSKSTETIVSKVELSKVEELETWMSENKISSGINIDADTKRYYPYDNLASNVIGTCGTDNQGLDGIESSYDDILKGTNGKKSTAISGTQDEIPDDDEVYIAAQNGSNIYLTIDSNIQAIAEKYLKQAVEEHNCKRGGTVLIENPKTGEILAMATYPDYNLNQPYTPTGYYADGWDNLTSEEKSEKIYTMWRNKNVVDTYEPGSTFKTIVASIAIEEGLSEIDNMGDYYCKGYVTVSDKRIECANTAGHGAESLRLALENSCNPALIAVGQRIGVARMYKYFSAFGLFDNTGIDLPSEGTSYFWDEKNVGPVELATMSFGQRFTITPMQLVKAVSAIANDGVLVTPHIVKAIEDADTGTITKIETNEERQVVSKETAASMKDIMKDVVEEGGGTYAQVSGYTIGGKTGTSEPDPAHLENGYTSSFLAIAPVENTELVCLFVLYQPTVGGHYGGRIVAPAVSQLLSEVLPYLNIPSEDQETNSGYESITVPDVTNKTLTEAKKTLQGLGLDYTCDGNAEDVITEQVPKSGTKLTSGGVVKLYTSEASEKVMQTVPDLKGFSFGSAKNIAEAKNLNISSTGSGIVIAQQPKAGEEVQEGTVIQVTLQTEAASNSQN